MNVKELMLRLQAFPDDTQVFTRHEDLEPDVCVDSVILHPTVLDPGQYSFGRDWHWSLDAGPDGEKVVVIY